MIIAERIDDVRSTVKRWRAEGLTVGLVPTMGALHQGHASLVTAAAKDCDRVVASVFVNPTQFGQGEDLDSYPRDFEGDCRLLEEKGCHLVFHPSPEEMYPDGYGTYVNLESDMTNVLCGKSRPGHFRGVCTVVSKLFNIVTPDRAYFGEKDAQQLAVIRRMVSDMNYGIEIVGCPTIRENDGLAKSSRNAYLSKEQRKAAAVLYRSIEEARTLTEVNEKSTSASELIKTMTAVISSEPMAKIDYIEAVDGKTLQPKSQLVPGDLVALAVYIGKTRLIDNFTV
ncbi:MAG: pantoate--beta-alanine ligase [Anaerovoracaceae bacterium]|nr:pantoate--beta-alanine ligase [Anaerovoracaceae bacterium]